MAKQDEVERKLPVWHALSELFLDSELQPADYARVAGQLRSSRYTTEEIRRILEDEVAPAFGSNLLSVAGEWAPWSEVEVRKVMERQAKVSGLSRWLSRRLVRRYVREEWQRLLPLLEA